MKIKSVGVVLAYYREKYKLTLEQVCDGICSESTLSRLENGDRCVDFLTSSLLLERIGKTVCQFEQLLNDADYELWMARESIQNNMQLKNYNQVREELSQYRKLENMVPGLHEQFCLYQEILILVMELEDRSGGRPEKQNGPANMCKMAMQALQLTKPGYASGRFGKNELYTTVEVELILLLIHYGAYQLIAREEILLDLFHHVEYYDSERRKQKQGSRILLELIELAQGQQDLDKVLKYINMGIGYVIQGRESTGLERLRFLRAQTLRKQYGENVLTDSAKRYEIQEECLMAYSICEIFGEREWMYQIERFCREELRWQITGLVM